MKEYSGTDRPPEIIQFTAAIDSQFANGSPIYGIVEPNMECGGRIQTDFRIMDERIYERQMIDDIRPERESTDRELLEDARNALGDACM
ncbi:MAG TPA: hypothetical protein VHT70_03265 [Candidatus Saccharimonadales bacterium]|jgi:hypothetical protein|nr:hypothetical protein [Candidatus Saccharimonadales bacterium]